MPVLSPLRQDTARQSVSGLQSAARSRPLSLSEQRNSQILPQTSRCNRRNQEKVLRTRFFDGLALVRSHCGDVDKTLNLARRPLPRPSQAHLRRSGPPRWQSLAAGRALSELRPRPQDDCGGGVRLRAHRLFRPIHAIGRPTKSACPITPFRNKPSLKGLWPTAESGRTR